MRVSPLLPKWSCIAAVMLLACRAWSVPIAMELYEYPEGEIIGVNGGLGFAAPWSGSGAVNPGSLAYVDPVGAVFPTRGNRVSTTTNGFGMFRPLNTSGAPQGLVDSSGGFGADGTTIYIAFLVRLNSGIVTWYGDYGGVSLFFGNTEQVFFGDLGWTGDHIYWGVDPQQGSGAVRESTVPVDSTVRLLVGRIDFRAGEETVRFYVDPPLHEEPAAPTVGPFVMHDTRFNRIRVQSGGNGRYSFDELRLGTTYADVVPATPAPVPRVATGSPAAIAVRSATAHGAAWTEEAAEMTTFFQFADRPNEAEWIPGTPTSVAAGAANAPFSAGLTGLLPHTTYSIRAVGRSGARTVVGEFVSFTTGNTPPVAAPDRVHSTTGNSVTFNPRINDSDEDGDALTITGVTNGADGFVTTNGTSILYSGGPGFNGNDTFSYTISDGFGGTATATVTLFNSIPVAGNQDIHPDFGPGGSTAIDITPLLSDADGDPVRILRAINGARGEVSFSGKVITYTAHAGFSGNDSFTYTVTDDAGGAATGVITFSNAHPTASNQSIHPAFGPGGGGAIDVSSLIDDADGDAVSIVAVTQGSHGAVSFDGLNVTYLAGGSFTGADSFTYTVSDGRGALASAAIIFVNAPPVAADDALFAEAGATAILDVLANDSDSDGDPLTVAAAFGAAFGTLATDGARVFYTPNAEFDGVDSFTYLITDRRGAQASAHVQIRASQPVKRELAAAGNAVPGLDGAKWAGFGAPSLFSEGESAGWSAAILQGDRFSQGIFSGESDAPVLRLRTGTPAVDAAGAALPGIRFRRFEDPVFAGESYAVIARVTGAPVTAANDRGIWASVERQPRLLARKGVFAPGTTGSRFERFTSIAMLAPEEVFFTSLLRHGSGGVDATNDLGLWLWRQDKGATLLLREGQVYDWGAGPRRIRTFKVLTPAAGSPGHARYDSDAGELDALIRFTNGDTAIARLDAEGAIKLVRLTGLSDERGRTALALGIPSSPGGGELPVALATLQEHGGGGAGFAAIFDFETEETLARQNADAAGVEGATFRSFGHPVAGLGPAGEKMVLFPAAIAGASKGEAAGLWLHTDDAAPALQMVARKGSEPPGAPGTKFARFESVTVLEGRGPVFTATLASASERVRGANDRGCWAMASDGTLRLLFREGDEVNGKTLRSFTLLEIVRGSAGQRRAWAAGDFTPSIIYRAFYSDGSQAIISLTVP